jgi:drug/metabolite transporter (DMT)-like permease
VAFDATHDRLASRSTPVGLGRLLSRVTYRGRSVDEGRAGARSATRRVQHLIGLLLVVVAAASFGALPLFARIAYGAGADPQAVLTIRFAIAAVLLWVIIGVRREPMPAGRDLWALIILGVVGQVGQSLTYYTALTKASVSLVALLLYLYPVLVTVLAAALLHERFTGAKIAALVLALAGASLAIGQVGHGHPLGVVLALSSAVIYSCYILLNSRLGTRTAALPAATVMVTAAALAFAGLALVHHPTMPLTPVGWAASAGLAVLGSVVATTCFLAGLQRVGPGAAATLSTAEPVVAVGLAVLVLGETLSPPQIAGALCILAALLLLARHPV